MPSHKIFTGTANAELAKSVCARLNTNLGKLTAKKFSDGEININIGENVRGNYAFVIQPTCKPTNENLMELLLICDALRRASARKIIAIIPFFGYSRQDRRVRSARVPISAKVVADMLTVCGVQGVVTFDIHAEQIQGFFNVPVDNLYVTSLFHQDIIKQNYHDPVIVSPDVGGVVRARAVAKKLECGLSIIDKRREEANKSEVVNIIGEVEGKTCIIIDDIVDTAGTLVNAAIALKQQKAKKVYAYITHPVLSGRAFDNFMQSNNAIDELIVTNSIPLDPKFIQNKICRVINLDATVAEAITRILNKNSVSEIGQ